jgi:hypothetical protein
MKKIYLNRDNRAYALVNDEDFEGLKQYHWMLKSDGYAYRQWREDGQVKTIQMHNQILGKAPLNKMVDHINHNELDNRRSNLRFVTSQENQLNRRGRQSNNTTGFNGVVRYKGGGKILKYAATVKRNGKMFYVGVFVTPLEAHRARILYLAEGK